MATTPCSENGLAVKDSNYIGVIQLHQCGTFNITAEGVYSCIILNSAMIQQTKKLGMYFNGRSK